MDWDDVEMSRIEKALNYFLTFIVFIVLIVLLGAFFPQYFGVASQIIIDNLENLIVLVALVVIIYIILGVIEER